MDKETKEKLEEILKTEEKEQEFLFGDNGGLWAIMILALLFMPIKQEPPVININIGDGKNVQ